MYSFLLDGDVNVCQTEHVFATVYNFSLADIASDLYRYHIIFALLLENHHTYELIHGSFNKHITKNHIKYCYEHHVFLDILNLYN